VILAGDKRTANGAVLARPTTIRFDGCDVAHDGDNGQCSTCNATGKIDCDWPPPMMTAPNVDMQLCATIYIGSEKCMQMSGADVRELRSETGWPGRRYRPPPDPIEQAGGDQAREVDPGHVDGLQIGGAPIHGAMRPPDAPARCGDQQAHFPRRTRRMTCPCGEYGV